MELLIKNASIVNEGNIYNGSVLIEEGKIKKIYKAGADLPEVSQTIDATDKFLIPGAIDDQVHFREPGLTHKADIASESRAAAAGGVTSFMEMPNTVPNTLTQNLLADKYSIASKNSLVNYSFFMGASNTNLEEVLKTNPNNVCGIKVFMGSSTGNMLVDNKETLTELFSNCKMLIATHCEDEAIIQANLAKHKAQYGENIPFTYHPIIRNAEACYKSSSQAAELAEKHNTRLHILHISTAKEINLFTNSIPLADKKITAEACVHHLWFNDADYLEKGAFIKWNPAVKSKQDQEAILQAILDNKIDVIATDHAPHTLEEKQNSYLKAPSGGPLIQHSINVMLELYYQGKITFEKIVEKMSHAPADLFQIEKRGYIKEGYYADLVLVNFKKTTTVTNSNLLYKCGWSPFMDYTFHSKIEKTLINGNIVYDNGVLNDSILGNRLLFNR